jgi:anti-anti-sigma factor
MTHGFTTAVSLCDAHTVRIRLGGELTFENAEELDVVISEHLLEFPEIQDLVLDCTDITAVDSIGLSTLLMAKRRAHQVNARLRLDNRPPRLDRMLTLTGTHAHFTEETAQA